MIRTTSTILTGEEIASEPGSGVHLANGSLIPTHAASPVEHPSTLAPPPDACRKAAKAECEPGPTRPGTSGRAPIPPPRAAAPLQRDSETT